MRDIMVIGSVCIIWGVLLFIGSEWDIKKLIPKRRKKS